MANHFPQKILTDSSTNPLKRKDYGSNAAARFLILWRIKAKKWSFPSLSGCSFFRGKGKRNLSFFWKHQNPADVQFSCGWDRWLYGLILVGAAGSVAEIMKAYYDAVFSDWSGIWYCAAYTNPPNNLRIRRILNPFGISFQLRFIACIPAVSFYLSIPSIPRSHPARLRKNPLCTMGPQSLLPPRHQSKMKCFFLYNYPL